MVKPANVIGRGVIGHKALWTGVATVGLLVAVGCSDDADPPASAGTGGTGGTGGGSGMVGGMGGTPGMAGAGGVPDGTGGLPAGGMAGSGGSDAGSAGSGGMDAGGAGSGGMDAGGAGSGGGAGAPAEYHPNKLNGPNGMLIPQVSDLRGLTFSASGKIWASGHVGVSTTYPTGVDRQLAIVRFNADGTLDQSFDGDGIKTINLRTRVGIDENIINDGDEYSMGIVELPDGNVVIQANVRALSGVGRDVVLLKMSPSGSLLNFGSGGSAAQVRKVDFGWPEAQNMNFPGAPAVEPTDEAWGLALDPSGTKVVIFGAGPAKLGEMTADAMPVQRTDNDRYVVRVNVSDGLPDANFNGGAPYSFNSGGVNADNVRRGMVEADGSIVSTGYTNLPGVGNAIMILRLSPAGVPDQNFTFNSPQGAPSLPGVFAANPFFPDGGVAECYQVGKQSTGRYVSVGYGRATAANTVSTFNPPWQTTDAVDLVAFGFKAGSNAGVLDTTFGVAGTLAIQSEGLNLGGTEDRGRDLVVLPDDRVVFAGRLGVEPALFVTTKDGELDSTEGGVKAGAGGGDTIPGAYTYTALSGSTSHFYAIALSADGKRVAATTNNHQDGALLALLKVE